MKRRGGFWITLGLLAVAVLAAGEETWTRIKGGIVRGDRQKRALALVFTGDSFAEGGEAILAALRDHQAKGSFFFTGNFLRNPQFEGLVRSIIREGHFLGPHSDRHLLYLSWTGNRLLVSREEFVRDVQDNLERLERFGLRRSQIKFWIPPYEHYNETIVQWSRELGLTLFNYSPGTLSHADYTGEAETNFRSSQRIFESILKREKEDPDGLNGFILLLHIGAGEGRKDKFHTRVPELLDWLQKNNYQLLRVDQLL